jgi:hypothetical protein
MLTGTSAWESFISNLDKQTSRGRGNALPIIKTLLNQLKTTKTMATRSRIGYIDEAYNIVSVYCHFDGYPSHNGEILVNHYKHYSKVSDLVWKGGISSLGKEVGYPHSFDDSRVARENDWTTFYHRDRGEDWEDNKPTIIKRYDYFISYGRESMIDYHYIWNGENWTCYDYKGNLVVLDQYKKTKGKTEENTINQ